MIDGLIKHLRSIEKVLRSKGQSREDAQDVIQETFLRVKLYLDEGGEIKEPEAFLMRTALNLSQDARKHEHRHLYSPGHAEVLLIPDGRPSPEEVFEAEQCIERLTRILNKAGPRTREIFLMHRLNGMSYLQIADHFGLTQSAVEKYIARAIAVLAEGWLEK